MTAEQLMIRHKVENANLQDSVETSKVSDRSVTCLLSVSLLSLSISIVAWVMSRRIGLPAYGNYDHNCRHDKKLAATTAVDSVAATVIGSF